MTGGQGRGQLLHELVVDPDVGERPGDGAGGGAEREPEERIQEDEPDERAPEAPAHRADGRHVVKLAQLHLAVLLAHGDHRVGKVDEVVLLHLEQREADLLGFHFVLVTDHDQRRHGTSSLLYLRYTGSCGASTATAPPRLRNENALS